MGLEGTICVLAVALLAMCTGAVPSTRHKRDAAEDAVMDYIHCHDLEDGFYPDPLSCRTYYVCSSGVAVRLPCQLGTHFDPALLVCNLPEQAGCRSADQPLFCDARPDGSYADPDDCTAFYQCVGTLTYRQVCPSGLAWKPREGICDYPASGSACDPVLPFCAHRRHGYYPDPTSCSGFYHCANGRTYRESCGTGLHWNDAIGGCDFPERAGCPILQA